MERVAFILEETEERINCMLNPESVTWRRKARIGSRRSISGAVYSRVRDDDPLLWGGGGHTELMVDLLFDVTLVERSASSARASDVRDLTYPLVELGRTSGVDERRSAPLVRFVWGKSWNVRCLVAAVAERFDRFTSAGVPQRSWLRVRFVRVAQQVSRPVSTPPPSLSSMRMGEMRVATAEGRVVEVTGGGSIAGGRSISRLDAIAEAEYGHAAFWRLIAEFNNIDNPVSISPGRVLRLPSAGGLESKS